jgi:hypothetical protein
LPWNFQRELKIEDFGKENLYSASKTWSFGPGQR